MQLGKLTFATDFAPRDIDSDVPAFHRELLCAWINYKCYHERIDIPDSLLDIFDRQFHKSEQILSPKLDYWRSFSLWHLLTRRYGTRCTHHWSLTLEGFPASVTYGLAAELNGCLCIGKLSSLWRHRNDRA